MATTCPAGKYCMNYASSLITDQCEAGYYCPAGQLISNPITYLCPPGSYCPQGSILPIPCPSGTSSPSKGASALSDCQPCKAGSVCASQGLNGAQSNCASGFYCPAGISSPNPTAYLCEAGYMCPAGSTYQQVCLPGTYQPGRGAKTCLVCPVVS